MRRASSGVERTYSACRPLSDAGNATEGWGGCAYSLYSCAPIATGTVEKRAPGDPDILVMVTEWDSEDVAVEFYGGLIGALEAHYPQQKGYSEASSQDMIRWNLGSAGHLAPAGRRVSSLEALPSAQLRRALSKLDLAMKVTDASRARGCSRTRHDLHESSVRFQRLLNAIKTCHATRSRGGLRGIAQDFITSTARLHIPSLQLDAVRPDVTTGAGEMG